MDSEKGENHLGHGLMESLHCCQSGGREVAKVTWEGVLGRREGTDVTIKFHVPCRLRIGAFSDCVDAVAELIFSYLCLKVAMHEQRTQAMLLQCRVQAAWATSS